MGERGFTLIELLVVILIIGVLAAIALPIFWREAAKARDTSAKADVRNAVSQMESCFRGGEVYTGCPDADSPLAPGVTVTVTAAGDGYEAARLSESSATFTITRRGNGYLYGCDRPGVGGCHSDSSW